MNPSVKPKSRKSASLSSQGQLRLELVDVYGTRLNQSVDILLRHQQLSDRRIVRGVRSSSTILIRDLHAAPQGLYQIEVDPPAYLSIAQFVNLGASGPTDLKLIFPLIPEKSIASSSPLSRIFRIPFNNFSNAAKQCLGLKEQPEVFSLARWMKFAKQGCSILRPKHSRPCCQTAKPFSPRCTNCWRCAAIAFLHAYRRNCAKRPRTV